MTNEITKRTMALLLIGGAVVLSLGGTATGALITIENVPLVNGVQNTTEITVAYDDAQGQSTQGSTGGQSFTTPVGATSYDLDEVTFFLAHAVNLNAGDFHYISIFEGLYDAGGIGLVGTSDNSIKPLDVSPHATLPYAEALDWTFTGLNLNPNTLYSAVFTDELGVYSGGIKIRVDDGDHYAGGVRLASGDPTLAIGGTDDEFIITLSEVPEPSALVLCGFGLMGLIVCGKRRK